MRRFRKLILPALLFGFLAQSASLRPERPVASRQKEPAEANTPGPRHPPSQSLERALTKEQFAQIVQKFSEPNGYFDSDN
jgi:hypothetical protein